LLDHYDDEYEGNYCVWVQQITVKTYTMGAVYVADDNDDSVDDYDDASEDDNIVQLEAEGALAFLLK
jgi:hypothetical protein